MLKKGSPKLSQGKSNLYPTLESHGIMPILFWGYVRMCTLLSAQQHGGGHTRPLTWQL